MRSRQGRWRWAGMLGAALVVVPALWQPREAFAQAGAQAAAAAELFKDGLALAKQEKFAEAAAKFQASYSLDPARGTLQGMAMAEERAGKLATAYGHYLELVDVSRRANDAPREKLGKEGLARLGGKVPKLTVVSPEPLPAGAELKMDDRTLPIQSIGTALPVDPGTHTIKVSSPGKKTFERTVTLDAGGHESVEIKLEAEALQPPAIPSTQATPSAPSASTTPPPAHPSSQKTFAFVAGGVGVAGIVVGAVTGLMSISKKKTVDDNCVGLACTQEGKDAADSGKTLATVSTIAFGVGIVGIAAGTVLLLTAKPSQEPAKARGWEPLIANHGASGAVLGLRGSW
jgi:hypothetical protein